MDYNIEDLIENETDVEYKNYLELFNKYNIQFKNVDDSIRIPHEWTKLMELDIRVKTLENCIEKNKPLGELE